MKYIWLLTNVCIPQNDVQFFKDPHYIWSNISHVLEIKKYLFTVSVFNTCQIAKTLLNTLHKYVGKYFSSAITIMGKTSLMLVCVQNPY